MMYSSAIFPSTEETLANAQRHKLEQICQRLELKAGERLLEIGTGWGALAIHAAKYHGVTVTTTTISSEQYRHALERVQAEGLESHITVLNLDYRDIEGHFDKVVSIEMIEAVGHRHLPVYFERIANWLKPEGRMLLQAITIQDDELDRYAKEVDFIQRYIFPGGALPSVRQMSELLQQTMPSCRLELHRFGQHYAETLRRWSSNLAASRSRLPEMGLDTEFYRLWQYYFKYCEAGFAEDKIDVVHLVCDKPAGSVSVC